MVVVVVVVVVLPLLLLLVLLLLLLGSAERFVGAQNGAAKNYALPPHAQFGLPQG